MNRLPLAALAALACLLVVLLLIESHGREETPLPLSISTQAPAAASGMSLSHAISRAPLESRVQTVLARPIFSPSRRPGSAVAAPSTALPRLAGIIVGPGGARAIFASSGDSRAIIAAAGGRAGPYLIRAVGLAGVSVVGPNGAELLHPAYDRNGPRTAVGASGDSAPPSILDLLRSRVQNGGGLNRSLISPPILQPQTNR